MPQPTANVLVKRESPVDKEKVAEKEKGQGPLGPLKRRMSRSRMPTLRRPATSHQRSATVQQFQHQGGFSGPPASAPKYSLDQPLGPLELASPRMVEKPPVSESSSLRTWTSYFHSRAFHGSGRSASRSNNEGSPNSQALPNKRLSLQPGTITRAFLTKPGSLLGHRPAPEGDADAITSQQEAGEPVQDNLAQPESTDSTPSRRARRSISQHFPSPPSWISKTGSIRRSKRGSGETKGGGTRNASLPISAPQKIPQPGANKPKVQEIFTSLEPKEQIEPSGSWADSHQLARKRNSSSPLPPLSRLSSFNLDVARLELSSSSSSGPPRPNLNSANAMPASPMHPAFGQSRAFSGERTWTLGSSDIEARDGMSGDDDDTDFKSETMFDSFRTVASSNRLRTVETPLESMFDESPPSTAGHGKPKRWSIQEILGPALDGANKIMEEDEGGVSTPIRESHLAEPVAFRPSVETDYDVDSDSDSSAEGELPPAHRDLARMSVEDDDDDEDWAREEENTLSNHLSPPSSSVNSRGVSPTVRHALASISGNSSLEAHLRDSTGGERPRSNIFDWCEPPSVEKLDADGHSPRPKTVHGKQEMDLRGGRSASRKGPSVAHVRSQSVPVVPDPADAAKSNPKFGTWGLGTKTASEDWDDDFDFDGPAHPGGGKDSATSFSMVVPASIQATQPTVKAHSGQIRELSLLVNDLKRLCRHGRDLDITSGSSAAKWMDAENIIALASPDEDLPEEEEDAADETSRPFERPPVEDRFLDEGFDARSLEHAESTPDVPEPEMSKTTVVRERQVVRRRSVFSPEDDIFGGSWPATDEYMKPERPHTPDQPRRPNRDSAGLSTVIEAMQQQRLVATPVQNVAPLRPPDSKLFFDTNSLQELVKRASHLRDSLSDLVRRAELLTQSPVGTPRRERRSRLTSDGSPAFTRVFTDPQATSPPRHVPKNHGSNAAMRRTSIDSPRIQMMTVN